MKWREQAQWAAQRAAEDAAAAETDRLIDEGTAELKGMILAFGENAKNDVIELEAEVERLTAELAECECEDEKWLEKRDG